MPEVAKMKRNTLDDLEMDSLGLGDDPALDDEEISLHHYRYILSGLIEDDAKYNKLILSLMKASPRDQIDFIINCDGGCMYLMNTIIQAFKVSGIKTRAIVMGKCYSAASMIALSCDEVDFRPGAEMMIHCAQLGAPQGPARSVETKVKFDRKSTEEFLDEIYGDFLTEEELEDVKEYKEVWLTHTQVEQRLKKWRRAKKVGRKVDRESEV